MSKQFTSSSDHLDSSAVATTASPITLAIWFYTTIAQGRSFISVGSDSSNRFCVGTSFTDSLGEVAASRNSTSASSQQAKTSILTASAWRHGMGVWTDASNAAVFYQGANKVTVAGGSFVPITPNQTVINGRIGDHVGGIAGMAAHAAAWSRALSDLECAYVGAGGNPRNVKGTVNYWKISTGESPVKDQIGTNDLTVTGTTSGSSEPNVQTYMTGGPVGALSYPVGSAITTIDLSAGHLFDDVSSPYTASLQQLAPPTTTTVPNASGTAVREIPMASTAAYTAGDYAKVTSGGTPTRVLAVGSGSILVANDQTFTTSSQLYRFAVNPLSVSGLSISSNVFSGTPSSPSTNALCLFRATCTGNTALTADSDVFELDTTSGGGGGSFIFLPAGLFSGGLVGG